MQITKNDETSLFSVDSSGNATLGNGIVITSDNIGSQSVNHATNATYWNGTTFDINTENNNDTWIPVMNSGKMQHTTVSSIQSRYVGTNNQVWTMSMGNPNGRHLQWGYTDVGNDYDSYWWCDARNGSNNSINGGWLWYNNKLFVGSDTWGYKPVYAGSFVNASSKIVKENITEISEEDAKKILELTPINFDYKESFGGEKNQIGLIAEDVLKILPKLVLVPDKYDPENTTDFKNILAIDYAKATPYLIKLIQIQQNEIDDLKARIEALENKK